MGRARRKGCRTERTECPGRVSRQVTGWGAPWRDGDLTLREQGGAFADFRGGERALGFARSNLVSCAGWAGEEGRGGREAPGEARVAGDERVA